MVTWAQTRSASSRRCPHQERLPLTASPPDAFRSQFPWPYSSGTRPRVRARGSESRPTCSLRTRPSRSQRCAIALARLSPCRQASSRCRHRQPDRPHDQQRMEYLQRLSPQPLQPTEPWSGSETSRSWPPRLLRSQVLHSHLFPPAHLPELRGPFVRLRPAARVREMRCATVHSSSYGVPAALDEPCPSGGCLAAVSIGHRQTKVARGPLQHPGPSAQSQTTKR